MGIPKYNPNESFFCRTLPRRLQQNDCGRLVEQCKEEPVAVLWITCIFLIITSVIAYGLLNPETIKGNEGSLYGFVLMFAGSLIGCLIMIFDELLEPLPCEKN